MAPPFSEPLSKCAHPESSSKQRQLTKYYSGKSQGQSQPGFTSLQLKDNCSAVNRIREYFTNGNAKWNALKKHTILDLLSMALRKILRYTKKILRT